MEKDSIKVMATNREARHEYFVEEEMEAGIELQGTEVKSIRAGTLNLKDAWCGIKDGEMILNQMHISPYDHGNRFNVDPRRPRRLLMHKREIMRLFGKVKQDGYPVISGPRVTGDGYYESCILGFEGNLIEITV